MNRGFVRYTIDAEGELFILSPEAIRAGKKPSMILDIHESLTPRQAAEILRKAADQFEIDVGVKRCLQ